MSVGVQNIAIIGAGLGGLACAIAFMYCVGRLRPWYSFSRSKRIEKQSKNFTSKVFNFS